MNLFYQREDVFKVAATPAATTQESVTKETSLSSLKKPSLSVPMTCPSPTSQMHRTPYFCFLGELDLRDLTPLTPHLGQIR